MSEALGFQVRLKIPYEQALERVIQALKAQGFGVLTRIDVKATLKERLGEDFRPYMILGACNPPLAHRALTSDPVLGLMLPCNVTVEADDQGGSIVRIANPEVMMKAGDMGDSQVLNEVAALARQRLEQVSVELLED